MGSHLNGDGEMILLMIEWVSDKVYFDPVASYWLLKFGWRLSSHIKNYHIISLQIKC